MGINLLLTEYSPNFLAIVIGTFFRGYQIIIPQMLNNVWENATVTAAKFPVTKEARIAVIVVPIFAPNV